MKQSCWMTLLLILLFACTAFADTGELAIDGDFTAIAAQGNTVYLLDKERNLFIVQAGQSFPEAPACTLTREADFLLIDQGVLYGFEPVSGALFRIDAVTGEVSDERMVGTADLLGARDGLILCEFSAPILHDGTLTVLWEARYNIQGIDQFAPDGTHTTYEFHGDGALFYGDPDGRIFVAPDFCGQVELGQLDAQGKFTWLRELPYDTWGIALRGETLYVGAGNYIEQYESVEALSGQISACLPQTSIDMGTQSMSILDDGWVALTSHGTFYLQRLDINQSTRVLTLPVELYSAREMNAAFLTEYPDIALRFADWWMDSPSTGEEYRQAIENLESDILECNIKYSQWQALKDEGYAADLSASVLIQQTVADMYPAFRDACMREGRVVGIPFACGLDSTLQINKNALLDKTGLTEEKLPKTLLDLPGFFSRWVAQYTQTNPDDESLDTSAAHMLCEAFIKQYVMYYKGHGEPLVFDTPLFRAGLALRDQIPKLPGVADKGAWSDVMGYSEETLSADQAPSILPLPLDAEHPYTQPVTLSLLFVNPNSPNMDLAVAYLESAIRIMPPEKRVLWMQLDGQPVPNPDYEAMLAEYAEEENMLRAKATAFSGEEHSWLERDLIKLQKNAENYKQYGYWLVSPDFLQAYGLLSEHMFVYQQDFFDPGFWASDHSRTASRLCMQYLNGEIDADTLIVRLQRIADIYWAAEE